MRREGRSLIERVTRIATTAGIMLAAGGSRPESSTRQGDSISQSPHRTYIISGYDPEDLVPVIPGWRLSSLPAEGPEGPEPEEQKSVLELLLAHARQETQRRLGMLSPENPPAGYMRTGKGFDVPVNTPESLWYLFDPAEVAIRLKVIDPNSDTVDDQRLKEITSTSKKINFVLIGTDIWQMQEKDGWQRNPLNENLEEGYSGRADLWLIISVDLDQNKIEVISLHPDIESTIVGLASGKPKGEKEKLLAATWLTESSDGGGYVQIPGEIAGAVSEYANGGEPIHAVVTTDVRALAEIGEKLFGVTFEVSRGGDTKEAYTWDGIASKLRTRNSPDKKFALDLVASLEKALVDELKTRPVETLDILATYLLQMERNAQEADRKAGEFVADKATPAEQDLALEGGFRVETGIPILEYLLRLREGLNIEGALKAFVGNPGSLVYMIKGLRMDVVQINPGDVDDSAAEEGILWGPAVEKVSEDFSH